jgi:hypothetical protein
MITKKGGKCFPPLIFLVYIIDPMEEWIKRRNAKTIEKLITMW